jgi:signal transduction histidine kinase
MGQTEIKIFIILSGIIVLIFVIGIILFVFQFRNRKILYQKEKAAIEKQYKLDMLNMQLESQQQTMQHIGTEIHDNVGQKLTLASLYSRQISAGATNLDEKIGAISKIIDESLTELRQLSKTLTNPAIANANLGDLLHEEATKINASGICHLAIITPGNEVVLEQTQKNILFRLLQEFIQNSLKHSGCRKIMITIQNIDNNLKIEAVDDGKGFDTDSPSGGIGIQNMKRRAEQLHASFELKSELKKGTSLNVQLQLN